MTQASLPPSSEGRPIETAITRMTGSRYPIIAAPMFLVSNEAMVCEATNAGAMGAAPSLNWRTPEQFEKAIQSIKTATDDRPYGINLIVNKSNARLSRDLEIVVRYKVPFVITSLGNPAPVIEAVHSYGGKVFCDVTDLRYALKVEAQGADAVIAVSSGAGGHAGPVSPMVLIPRLKESLSIPVIAAGGIANGAQILAALVLGADAVQIGTRFIASTEASVSVEYKEAILTAEPEDIVLTKRITGTPASVIKTGFVEKIGYELPWWEKLLRSHPLTMRYMKLFRYMRGSKSFAGAAKKPTWKTVWSAGQGAGLVHDVIPTAQIVQRLVKEYWAAKDRVVAER